MNEALGENGELLLECPIRWADVDANGHVRHSVYLDLGAHARITWLERAGYGLAEMRAASIGPILFKETASYRREVRAGDMITVDVLLTGLSENNKHFAMRHEMTRRDGQLACVVDCRGAWMDIKRRSVVAAPAELSALLAIMPRADDYQTLRGGSI